MKRIYFLLSALLFISAAVSAQTEDSTLKDMQRDILKINVLSLPLKNVSVQYEYILSKKISLALGGRVMHSTAIPFEGLVLDLVGEDDVDTRDFINTSRLANFAITPEVRFYLGKGYGQGFYVAPYYRFVHFSTNTGIVNYSDPNGGPKRSVTLNGDMNAHTGGVMFGLQKNLGKHFAIDWWIIGAHFGHGSGNFIGIPSPALSAAEQADIRQTLDNIDIPLIHKTHNVTANRVEVNFNGAFGGLRSGLCFGVRL